MPVELYVVKNRYGPLNLDRPVRLDFDRGFGGFRVAGVARIAGNGSSPANGAPRNPPALYPQP